MKKIIVLLSLLSSISFAQSEGPYRKSDAKGSLVKPAQGMPSESTLKQLVVPKGYKVQVFAKDLKDPRMMVVDENDNVYVSRPKSKDILILKDADKNGESETKLTFASNVEGVHGLALNSGKIYYVALKKVYVSPLGSSAKPKMIIGDLPDVGQHENRSIAIGPDGKLYVSIASNCNACVDPNKKMATMRTFTLDGQKEETFATGLRDTIGFDWHPESREMYGIDHGTDWRGDALPKEELNLLVAGKDYGWPFCWNEKHPDDNLIDEPEGKTKKEFCPTTESPVLTYDAHAAPIAMKFYRGEMFPELKGSALVAMHGSWNRSNLVGYNVQVAKFEGGKPKKFENLLTGFLSKDKKTQFGRPAGIAFMKDGSILVSDDSGGVIYRISK